MSKDSRRAARLARESRRAGAGAAANPTGASTPGSGLTDAGAPSHAPAGPPTTSPAGTSASGSRRTGGALPAGTAGPRAGRRDRPRYAPKQSFLERYRSAIVAVVGIAVVALAAAWVFIGSTQPAYACSNIFSPSPTPPLAPDSSARLGFPQEDMAAVHSVTPPQQYLFCPPASGNHYNATGLGPITPRLYKPEDKVGPPNWVHNLEHGGLVVLYRNDSPGATAAGQQAFRDYFDAFPASAICQVPPRQISPVIARFDQMPHPYAALVWDRVFYLDTWDADLVNKFYLTEAERLDAEGQLIAPPEDVTGCKARLASSQPSASAGASGSPAVSAGPSASAAASVASSAAPAASPEPSAAPS